MSMLFFRFYLRLVSLPLALALYIGAWKKSILRGNALHCGVSGPFFRLRLCSHVALDFIRLAHGRYGTGIRSRPKDTEKLKILKSSPSLFLTAHFHNWELMGSWLTREGVPLLSVARPLAQPRVQALLENMRTRLGLATISREVPRKALKHLAQGGCFGMLWDQRVKDSRVHVPFFGHSLRVDPLPPFLLRHRPVPVWFGVLLPDGTFRLFLLAPALRSSLSPDPIRLARRYHRILEVLIARHPTWWYGMAHRRFLESSPSQIRSGVSRETSVASGLRVSRETKARHLPA
jgi:hypothetical protein